MNRNLIILSALIFIGSNWLTSCSHKPVVDGAYDFIIYESDDDNTNLADNKIVVKYHIEYSSCQTVSDTLIKKGSAYFFNEESSDYLILKNSAYGLTYSEGYFENYSECANGEQIDVSWSYTTVNGVAASYGIGETPLDGLNEYGFVINGWKTA
jgi:hypothetical protein